MHFGDLRWGEVVAMVGGALLALAVFLPWYSTGNANTSIGSHSNVANQDYSAWQVLPVWRFLLLLAAIAPFILAWIIVREHALSWPRGELTAVVGLSALTLILVKGFIFKPGEPTGQISLSYGYFLALFASILILIGAFVRSTEIGKARKPPGVM
jgi:fucose 4-O-acetylase-like acetyltransferase